MTSEAKWSLRELVGSFSFFPHAGDRFLYYIIKKENYKMDAKLFLIVFICIAALGLVLGIAIGFNLSEGQRCVGDLVIAPGDEDADHYMFLDLAKSPETLAGKERVMLNIKMIRTRK
jgi:hypothetical protein